MVGVWSNGVAKARVPHHLPVRFQKVEADYALFIIHQRQAEEIERHQALEQAAQIGEERG